MNNLGVVVIGRNEGNRLRRCLESVVGTVSNIVYVDSASIDDSVEVARSMKVEVVVLEDTAPFTAARARNAGAIRLLAIHPETDLIQFIDGDCEIMDGWIEAAAESLRQPGRVALVAGRLRERHPENSIYNRLCDIEWDTPAGESQACGGIFMIRAKVFSELGGFRTDLIAGEEPELCVRLRQRGDRIYQLDAEMARHDAAMTRFSQWWRRSVRTGYGYAQGAALYGLSEERFCVRQVASNTLWGGVLPLLIVALLWPTHGLSVVCLLGYPVLLFRIARKRIRTGLDPQLAWYDATFCVLGKLPQAIGQVRYCVGLVSRRRPTVVEDKDRQGAIKVTHVAGTESTING